MNGVDMVYQAFGLLFLFAAMGFSVTLIISGFLEVVNGPAKYLDQMANRSIVGITFCMLMWWYVAAV